MSSANSASSSTVFSLNPLESDKGKRWIAVVSLLALDSASWIAMRVLRCFSVRAFSKPLDGMACETVDGRVAAEEFL